MNKISYTSNEVKKRYIDKTYKRYCLNLKISEDKSLIDHIEKEKEKGFSPTDTIKKLLKQK